MNTNLLKGNVAKALFAFALPFLLSNLLQVLYGSADLFVVGQFASTGDVSGVSIGSQTMMLFTQFILGLTTGVTVLMGQYFGLNNEKQLSKTVGASICLFATIGIILTIVIVGFNHSIVSLMNTPIEAVEETRNYLMICSLGFIFIIGYNVVSAILRGIGNSKTPLLFVFIACIINIFVDFLLVGYFHMGASGAAIATVSSQALSFGFSIVYLMKKGMGFSFDKKDIQFSKMIKKILQIGMPLGLQSALISISFLFITVIINGMGVVASAAVGVDEKLIEFLMLPSIAFGSAISTMVAQNVGAGQPQRAKDCTKYGLIFCLIFAVVIVFITHISPNSLTSLFSKDQEVIRNASLYLQTYSIDCLCTSLLFCLNGYLNGLERTVFTMVHSLIATFAVRIPVTYFFSKMAGVTLFHMGIASPVASVVSLILIYVYLKKNQLSLR